ncbi:YjcQ family protein [Anaeromicrobium sediminis]|uniref:DUF2513 domain-containing protein n=1 Tax=Anaeromicrobium sediminis TaxID=1478221 RepID=A0A267MP02_9FIRM|nr:YjcQ family protein [Anaeromicrobium sediminis]PAB61331.1 hypothetical protein CCE28_02555 [Anaeromicrobium sediminis]
MKLDIKQKVLVSIYLEYQKDIPDMENNINPEIINLDEEKFIIALRKLENEGYIKNFQPYYADDEICDYGIYGLMITRDGIDYIEQKIGIDKTLSGMEKIKYVLGKGAELGWQEIKDIVAKTLVEMTKG